MIVASWSVNRGRSYEIDQNSPGTASVTLVDTTGELDPTAGAYPFRPGTPAALALRNPVTSTDHTVFRGHCRRASYNLYPTETYAEVDVELVDGLDRLARMEMYGGEGYEVVWGDFPRLSDNEGDVSFFADDQSNAVANRINKLLDQAGWPTGLREIFSGNVSLQGVIYSHRTPAMTAIQDAADAEFPGVANFYIQGNGLNAGKATFHGRLARFFPENAEYHIAIWRCGDADAVAADSSRAIIHGLEFEEDEEKVINAAQASPQNIPDSRLDDQRVEDAASIAEFGTRGISFENLLTAGDPDVGLGYGYTAVADDAVLKFADYYVSNMAQPVTRVSRITFKANVGPGSAYAERLWRLVCNVEISDIIRLKTTHIAGGFNDVDFFVEGLHYEATALSDDYDDVTLTLDVSPRAWYDTNPF